MSLLYNTDMIKASELPTTRREWADPKWAGKYAASTFITEWNYATLFYDQEELLQIADQVGKNAVTVLTFDAQLDRMLLGEFAMGSMNTYQAFQIKAKDKNAPIGYQYFKDFSPMTQLLYSVRKGAKAPASATLFTLWSTTPEFQQLHQPETFYPNLQFGDSEQDNEERRRAEQAGTKFVTWMDNDKNRAQLEWLGSPEGRAYSEKLVRAITQRKSP
jgi:ABC-type Fe3+ transport system substrate-binding protein